jgi:hypothetical protein
MASYFQVLPSANSEDLGVDGNIISVWNLGKYGGRERAGCTWLRISTNGGLL